MEDLMYFFKLVIFSALTDLHPLVIIGVSFFTCLALLITILGITFLLFKLLKYILCDHKFKNGIF